MFSRILKLSLLSLLSLTVLATPHASPNQNRHADLAKRRTGDVVLHKRFEDARWTYFAVGLGACGKTNVPADFIVALNSAQYDSGNYCFESILMTYNGKTATATIMDRCPGCPYGGLDLSEGLFQHFASESEGVLYGTWVIVGAGGGGGGGSQPTTTSTWTPWTPLWTPTTTWKPKPTTTWTPEPTTTWTPPPVVSTSSIESSSSVWSSSSVSTNATTTTYTPTTSAVPTPTETIVALQDINQIIVNLGGVLLAGAAAN